eukprot:TRINITY_DN24990_c0_g5_i2.p3 TRINITY_DN24990_c0_g5~~TRINITY_DN24990_c0_g5_i2.p3  ORF type:complete len:110 (-),score=12.72 TRINITY_DN24990_c0_g5_i2:4-333(-)
MSTINNLLHVLFYVLLLHETLTQENQKTENGGDQAQKGGDIEARPWSCLPGGRSGPRASFKKKQERQRKERGGRIKERKVKINNKQIKLVQKKKFDKINEKKKKIIMVR